MGTEWIVAEWSEPAWRRPDASARRYVTQDKFRSTGAAIVGV